MPGSSFSVAEPNVVLNTAVAEALDEFSTRIEASKNVEKTVWKLINETITKHNRIIFNGNGYSEEWLAEAERRGLSNLRHTAEAVPHLLDEKNVRLYEKYGVYSRKELEARCEIILENYCKTIRIEALTTADMAKRDIFHCVNACVTEMCGNIAAKHEVLPAVDTTIEEDIAAKLSALNSKMMAHVSALEAYVVNAEGIDDVKAAASYYREKVFFEMQKVRAAADEMETLCDSSVWCMPTYGDLLYSI